MNMKPDDLNRLHEVFAGKGLLLAGDISSPVEKLCCYVVYNFLRSTKNEKVIWVATDDPYEKVVERFAEYDYNIRQYLSRFCFVDLISLKSGADTKENPHVKYVQDPGNLTELSLAISEHMEEGKTGMVVLYIMNSLLIYNELPRALEFTRVLVARAFEKKFALLAGYIEGEYDERARTAIELSMDAVAKFEGECLHMLTTKESRCFSVSFGKDRLKVSEAEGKCQGGKPGF